MGGRFVRGAVRQHPDLTAFRCVVLTLLTLDGVITALLGAFFLPLRIGTAPFPLSALIVGAVNAALVWAASQWTDEGRLAALPLWGWLATLAVLALYGPGGDVVFGGRDLMAFGLVIYTAVGAAPAAWLLWRARVS
ncbi:hypothetical protein AU196_13965 [Mycobacterium sp. IS-1742]|uniref:hypothetical protein n=1 Tax=Mycobacterium sp. IS-1742 TaxID=1772285 RepID=UPI0007402813|nr:hypothetical protein [Mycobacterium sp. IS-1742]KUI30619.1 hypothetical protein AU196_13965 [Mycobacterium sp. IS-1742]